MGCKVLKRLAAEQGFICFLLFRGGVQGDKPLEVVKLATELTPRFRVTVFKSLQRAFRLIRAAISAVETDLELDDFILGGLLESKFALAESNRRRESPNVGLDPLGRFRAFLQGLAHSIRHLGGQGGGGITSSSERIVILLCPARLFRGID